MAASGEDHYKEIHEHSIESSDVLSKRRRLMETVTASQEVLGQHAESQQLSGDIDTAPREISGQHEESQEFSGDIHTVPPEISGQHSESQELSGDIDTVPQEISGQHEGDIDTIPQEISGQHEESQELSGDIDTAPQEISGQHVESQELSGDIDTAPHEISGQHVESQELSGDIDTAPQEISGQHEESQELSGDIDTAPQEISGQHVESQELSGDIDTAPHEISGQHVESQELSGDIDTAPQESVEQDGTQGDSQENLDTHLTAQETASTDMRLTSSEGASQTYEDRSHFMLNTVAAWRREKIYITKGVEAVKEKISSKGCVCVIGVPGAGKSTALHHAALSLQTDGFIVYCVYGPDEFLKYYDVNKKQVFVLDDALGVYSVDQGEVKLWQKHNENVRLALGTNTKLLVSIRTQIFMYETIRDKNIVFLDKSVTTDHVDYSDADYKLGIDDMRGMLTHYMRNKGTHPDNINKVIKQVWGYTDKELTEMTEEDRQHRMSWYTAGVEFSQCFPLLCGVYINAAFLKQNPREFFTNPFPALTKVFQNIKTDNKHQFCALVLCTVFDGKLNSDMFSPICEFNKELNKNNVEIRNVIMTSCDLKGQECLPQIKTALNSLNGVYVTRVENTYKMTHAVFHDVVTYLFNGGDPSFVLKYGTKQFIRDRIRLSNTQSVNDPYMIIINDDTNIERLADRLFRDCISDRETGDKDTRWIAARFITKNPNIDDDRLISRLRSKLLDRAQTDKTLINDLFIQCMWTVRCNRNTYKHGDVTQYKLIQTCLQVADVDCNQYIYDLRYPLHISVMTGSLQLTQLLLHHGADKRRVDGGGESVLHWLCIYTKYNKVELVKLLVQGDLSVVNRRGRTIHDNILTHVDCLGRNILHHSVDDYDLTEHLLTYPSLQKHIHKCDMYNRTPCWYIINNKKPCWHGDSKDIVIKKKHDMIQLYKKHGATL